MILGKPLLAALACGLIAAGCSEPRLSGPQIDGMVEQFALDRDCAVTRSPLKDRPPAHARCFVRGWDKSKPDCWITISRFESGYDRDSLQATRDAYAQRFGGCHGEYCTEFSAVDTVDVGGKPGWAYVEVRRLGERIDRREVHALVAWDDVSTYGIDIAGHGPEFRTEAALKTALTRFTVRSEDDHDLLRLAIGAAVVIAALLIFKHIAALRADRRDDAAVRARTFVTPPSQRGVSKPPLLEAGPRVEALQGLFAVHPDRALQSLESLRELNAPNQHVLHALVIDYAARGRQADALAIAREAMPLFFQRGCYAMAVETWKLLGPRAAASLELSVAERRVLAEAMLDAGDWRAAQPLYESLLAEVANDEEIARGLLMLVERHLEPAGLVGEAATVCQFVTTRVPTDSPAARRAAQILARTTPFV